MIHKASVKLFVLIFFLNIQPFLLKAQKNIFQPDNEKRWVDSIVSHMTLDEKIGQLFMIRGNAEYNKYNILNLSFLINQYKVGGICFFGGTPSMQVKVTNYLQRISKTPLFIAIDGEWGLAMRLDSTHSFPRQIVLGATKEKKLAYDMGTEIAHQCKCMGIHMNFSPDVDVNSNPKNPIIGSRSFGEDKINVAQKGLAYMNGLQDNQIIACAKHFPGHGETENDSHLTLPKVPLSKEQIDSVHLYPFKVLIDSGVKSVMVAHLFVPALDTNAATSLSEPVISGLLKEKMGFKGLVITDALEMRGVTSFNFDEDIYLKAFVAGNDIFLLPENIGCAVDVLKQAVDSGRICIEDIDERCRKILKAKYFVGLADYYPTPFKGLSDCLQNKISTDLNEKIFRSAITLVKNNDNLIPLRRTDTLRIATLSIGFDAMTAFQHEVANYVNTTNFYINKKDNAASAKMLDSLYNNLSSFNLLIINLENTSEYFKKDFGINKRIIDLIDTLQNKIKIILDVFASPYSLAKINTSKIESVIVSYDDVPESEIASAKIIFGDLPCLGKLPVSVNHRFALNSGFQTEVLTKLMPTELSKMSIDTSKFNKIDSIAISGIKEKAYPGCVVFAAKDGKIIYQKAFGTPVYESLTPIKENDIFDLASLTKVLATTLAVMKLYDEGKINPDSTLGKYILELKKTDKGKLTIREVMTHQAGLVAWIPFYKEILNKKTLFSTVETDSFSVHVAENFYLKNDYVNVVMQEIYNSPLQKKKKYKYSDLGFYLMKEIVENVTGKKIDAYVDENFYRPMLLSTTGFCPLKRFPLQRIIPTENDTIFRKQLIHGYVHDPGAAMLGGVSGHAGLFSDAYDVAVIMQMLLNKGIYKGNIYLKASTIDDFLKIQFQENDNRRAMGFDKPEPKTNGNTAKSASAKSFGHSGFTGTFTWADPENNLLFVFLSNRVYPTADNDKLVKDNIRTNILQLFYDAVGGKK